MSTPEHGTSGSHPEPAVEFESTGLWPIDDPEQTSHIQRPPATPPTTPSPAVTDPTAPAPDVTQQASTTPVAPGPAAADDAPSPHVDPEATSIVPRPIGTYTQPWATTTPSPPAPTYGPTGYAATYNPTGGYHHHQYSGNPQSAAYQPAPGYPPGSSGYPTGYPTNPGPGYPNPQQSPAAESTTNYFDFTTNATVRPGRRRTALLIGAGVAVIAIAAVGVAGFWKPGFFVTRQLNIAKVQEGVQHILTDPQAGYGISGVSGLSCNNGQNPSANQGDKFTCEMLIDGTKRHVEVTVTDDHGSYQVGKVT